MSYIVIHPIHLGVRGVTPQYHNGSKFNLFLRLYLDVGGLATTD
jgi:hypothetical protein